MTRITPEKRFNIWSVRANTNPAIKMMRPRIMRSIGRDCVKRKGIAEFELPVFQFPQNARNGYLLSIELTAMINHYQPQTIYFSEE